MHVSSSNLKTVPLEQARHTTVITASNATILQSFHILVLGTNVVTTSYATIQYYEIKQIHKQNLLCYYFLIQLLKSCKDYLSMQSKISTYCAYYSIHNQCLFITFNARLIVHWCYSKWHYTKCCYHDASVAMIVLFSISFTLNPGITWYEQFYIVSLDVYYTY